MHAAANNKVSIGIGLKVMLNVKSVISPECIFDFLTVKDDLDLVCHPSVCLASKIHIHATHKVSTCTGPKVMAKI